MLPRPLNFSPVDVHPSLLSNRQDEREELLAAVVAFVERGDTDASGIWAVIGDKGIGKTILTRAVLDDVRNRCSGTTVVATVDCRNRRDWRHVLAALCSSLLKELRELQEMKPGNKASSDSDALVTEADLLSELARFDTAELSELHQRALTFKASIKTRLARNLLKSLQTELGLDLEREEKTIDSLKGTRSFDEDRLSRALCALCRDIRAAGLGIVIYLDNVDELEHNYGDKDARDRIRRDVEGVLQLTEAPAALILNMRTYFSRVLPRQMTNPPLRIGPLTKEELLRILDKRLKQEDRATQEGFAQPGEREAAEQLAHLAPTVLAFLKWVHFLYQYRYLTLGKLDEGFSKYVYRSYSTLEERQIVRLMEAFDTPTSKIDRARLLQACEGSETLLHKLEDRQVVLPEDFWSPDSYTLDPMFQVFHLRIVGSSR
jgi:Cdc6-like AAA superfamily ATPase